MAYFTKSTAITVYLLKKDKRITKVFLGLKTIRKVKIG